MVSRVTTDAKREDGHGSDEVSIAGNAETRLDGECPVEALEVLQAVFGAYVPVGRAQLRVAEVVPHEHRIGDTSEDAAGLVPEAMQLDGPQSGGLGRELVAAAERRRVEPASEPIADDVVVVIDELDA